MPFLRFFFSARFVPEATITGKDARGAHSCKRTQAAVAPELKTAVSNLNSALIEAQKLTKGLNSNVSPQADRTLKELQAAARSIKVWAAYLERNPEALIRGKRR